MIPIKPEEIADKKIDKLSFSIGDSAIDFVRTVK